MKKTKIQFTIAFFVLPIAVILFFSCAAKKQFWGDEKTGFLLTYRMDKDQVLQYHTSGKQDMSLERMGQSMDIITDFMVKYSLKETTNGVATDSIENHHLQYEHVDVKNNFHL